MIDATMRTGADQWRNREQNAFGILGDRIAESTDNLPPEAYLWAALGTVGVAFGLRMAGKRTESQFVGRWAATFLVFGLYNKLAKSDQIQRITH